MFVLAASRSRSNLETIWRPWPNRRTEVEVSERVGVRESQGFDPDTRLRHSCANFLRNTATSAREMAGRQGFEHAPHEP
jgi:hypothetical protein